MDREMQIILKRTWQGIKQRCYNPNTKNYGDYGGRGIKVCDRWLESVDNFINDMGPRPIGKSIDRINVNGDYEPKNCRWADRVEQRLNQRDTLNYLEFNGKRMPIEYWARELGLHNTTIRSRIRRGYTLEMILSPKIFKCGKQTPFAKQQRGPRYNSAMNRYVLVDQRGRFYHFWDKNNYVEPQFGDYCDAKILTAQGCGSAKRMLERSGYSVESKKIMQQGSADK